MQRNGDLDKTNKCALVKDEIYGYLPVHMAFKNGNIEYGKILQQFSNINEVDKNGYTSLHLAAKYGQYDCIKYLIENGADYDLVTIEGKSALDFVKTRPKLFRKYKCLLEVKKLEMLILCANSDNEYNEYSENIIDFMNVFVLEIIPFLY